MYIETSSPRRPGDKAKLVFTVPNNGETSCLSFYYHMYGPTVGTLIVYSGNSKVFNISGYQNHNWILAKTNIILNGLVRNRIVLTHTSSSPSSHHHNHTITIIIIIIITVIITAIITVIVITIISIIIIIILTIIIILNRHYYHHYHRHE